MQTAFKFEAVHFDPPLSQSAKVEGMEAASQGERGLLLAKVQDALKRIAAARPNRTATADDGQAWLVSQGYQPGDLGNAAGSMFSRKEWEFTGQWTKSARLSSHKNDIRIWRLK